MHMCAHTHSHPVPVTEQSLFREKYQAPGEVRTGLSKTTKPIQAYAHLRGAQVATEESPALLGEWWGAES